MILLTALLALSGCANNPCEPGEPYRQAQTVPSLKAPSGLQVPAPDPSMQIPDVAPGLPEFDTAKNAKESADGDTRRCLAIPPPLPAQNAPGPRAALRD